MYLAINLLLMILSSCFDYLVILSVRMAVTSTTPAISVQNLHTLLVDKGIARIKIGILDCQMNRRVRTRRKV